MRVFGRLALVGLLALSACGFEPLYARRDYGVDVPEQLAKVRIGVISDPSPSTMRGFREYPIENDRSRQILRNYLLDDLQPRGGAARGEYVLNIEVIEPRTDVAIDRSDTTLRYGYSVVAYFSLRDNAGRNLVRGSSVSATSFAVSQSEFATISSQKEARDRAMQEISQDIRNQLAAFFHSAAKAPQ
jgi:LPS-assembly lipoprotein